MSVVLLDVPISGQMRKLVLVTGKTGQAFILDRLDGSAPLGIDEVPVPTDTRQAAWPTQPRPRQGGWTESCPVTEPLGGPVPGNPNRAVPNYPTGCLYAPHWDGAPRRRRGASRRREPQHARRRRAQPDSDCSARLLRSARLMLAYPGHV